MDPLKQLFYEKSQALGKEVRELLKEHGNKKVDDVSLDQVFGGMRDITCMLWEPSLLDAEEGIRFRGYSIPELRDKLPRAAVNGKEPLPEGLFWLMLVGENPPARSKSSGLTEKLGAPAPMYPNTYSAPSTPLPARRPTPMDPNSPSG
jgi:citrate synthase